MAREPWDASVIAYLITAKQNGLSFDWAWQVALERYPPRSSDLIVTPPDGVAPPLFDEQGQPEESVVQATRRFADEAWHGDRPKLRHWSADILRGAVDGTSSASVMGDYRTAA